MVIEQIKDRLIKNGHDYMAYEELGDYYSDNINQSYLCYEEALSCCDDEEKIVKLKEKMSAIRNSDAFIVKPFSVIILSYNSKDIMIGCLESIRKNCNPETYEIVVVDNASSDGIRDYLLEQKDIKLKINDTNSGFAAGCNQGAQMAQSDNDIFLLNNDTVITEHAMFYLRLGLYSDSKIGAAGPISNSAIVEQRAIGTYNTLQEWIDFAKTNNTPAKRALQINHWLQGHALLIKRSVWNQIGGLDERYIYGLREDDDYGLKLNSNGYKTVICRNSFIFHYGSVSMSKKPQEYYMRLNDNLRRLNEKWGFEYSSTSITRYDMLESIKEEENAAIAILDVGCGLASTQLYASYKYPNSRVVGIEKNAIISRIANNYTTVICGDIETMDCPFESESFDYIFAGNVIQYLYNPKEALKKLYKYLKPGGTIAVGTMNAGHISVLMGLVYGELQTRADTFLDKNAIHRFTIKDLEKLLSECGYKIRYYKMRSDTRYIDNHSDAEEFAKYLKERCNISRESLNISEFIIIAEK